MSVKIRLQRKGRRKRPFYHIVVADARSPRDGKFIERLGSYNPMTKPATIEVDRDKAYQWLMNGAQPTDTVRAILSFKGVYYKKHLMRGVQKGAMTPEDAEQKYEQWVEAKEAKVAARAAKTVEEIRAFHAAVAGTPPPKEAVVIPAVEVAAPEAVAEAKVEAEAEAPVTEETTVTEAEATTAGEEEE